MPAKPRYAAALLAAALVLPAAQATMYRWVDENGITVYSQTPPEGDSVRIEKQAGPSAAEQEAARTRLEDQIKASSEAAEAAQTTAREEAAKAEQEKRRGTNCEIARRNLQTLQDLGPRMLRTPEGEYIRPSEQDVAERTAKANAQIEEFCK